MPAKRKEKASPPLLPEVPQTRTSSLPPEIQRRIDDVAAGKSATLSLLESLPTLTEVPPEIRDLTGLRTLTLGPRIEKLPSWLAELPNLEQININSVYMASAMNILSSRLPTVHWGVTARQAVVFRGLISPSKIYHLTMEPEASRIPFDYVFDLGFRGMLELSSLSIFSSQPSKSREKELLTKIDEFLQTQPMIRSLTVAGFPFGRVPESIRSLHHLTEILLVGANISAIPDWLFQENELAQADFGVNNLSSLPESLAEASQLTHLKLDLNQFRRIPDDVWKLTKLQALSLLGCPIEEIPADILRLPNLSRLDIDRPPEGILAPPPEIVVQGLAAIRRYWQQERDAGVD